MKKELSELGTLANHTDKMFYDFANSLSTLEQKGFNPETEPAKSIAKKINEIIISLANESKVVEMAKILRETSREVKKAYSDAITEDLDPVEMAQQSGFNGS